MFTTVRSADLRGERCAVHGLVVVLLSLLTLLPQLSAAQEFMLASATPMKARALARVEAEPAEVLSLFERLEVLEQFAESTAAPEMKALFAEGLPCQIHARAEDQAVIVEVHPLFPANAAPAAPALASPMTPTPSPAVQETAPQNAADQTYMSEKIQSLQRMLQLMEAKEKLMAGRNYYERKLGEFDVKVRKE